MNELSVPGKQQSTKKSEVSSAPGINMDKITEVTGRYFDGESLTIDVDEVPLPSTGGKVGAHEAAE
jgi:hypothetical protein